MNEIEANDKFKNLIDKFRRLISSKVVPEPFEPLNDYTHSGSEDLIKLGKNSLCAGKTGCIVLAGGQGTRLGFSGPKGMFPIYPDTNKTLFHLLAEKILVASQVYSQKLRMAIMTSPLNDVETRQYFYDNQFFGLESDQISFFVQDTLPFIDDNGQLFLESPNTVAEGPDGNGHVLHKFVKSGLYAEWKNHGIKFVNMILIDNALSDPFDAEMIGCLSQNGADVVVKAIMREDPAESVGVLVERNKNIQVVEYTEIPESERNEVLANGTLKHPCANISTFCFDMDFVLKVSQQEMPYHKAYKTAKKIDNPSNKAWKFETYIFDVLPFSAKTSVLVYPRAKCFAPLKNAEGANSPETVRQALSLSPYRP